MSKETVYAEPTWKINMNGNTANDIKQSYINAHRAALELSESLKAVYSEALHNRNYQTLEHDGSQDRETLQAMLIAVRLIEEHCVSGAARAIKQREGL